MDTWRSVAPLPERVFTEQSQSVISVTFQQTSVYQLNSSPRWYSRTLCLPLTQYLSAPVDNLIPLGPQTFRIQLSALFRLVQRLHRARIQCIYFITV